MNLVIIQLLEIHQNTVVSPFSLGTTTVAFCIIYMPVFIFTKPSSCKDFIDHVGHSADCLHNAETIISCTKP